MISKFFREQKRYSQRELCEKLECTDEKIVHIIRKLKEFGVLKAVKSSNTEKDRSEISDDDIEIADVEVGENEYLYVITFVGVIVVYGFVLKCYPKYISKTEEPFEELKQVLKVLEKHNSKEQIIRLFNENSESSSFNLLAVLIFLLQDYYDNGLYTNTEDIIESNGMGEILWDKTINETFAILLENRPYYTDLQTRKRVVDDFDYFTRLHQCILTKASNELKNANLLDIFEITEIDLTDEEIDDFGGDEYILYRIERELNTQFNTRKQLVLKTMYAYIGHGGSLYDIDSLSLFGTNSFHVVWEDVCQDILEDMLQKRLGEIKLPVKLQKGYKPSDRLIDIIEKPLWTITEKTAADTLVPDLITIREDRFYIFDAKYYKAKLEQGQYPKGQPGIESVTKQYLYQLAYKRFIEKHGFASVENCFLLPTEEDMIIDKGSVRLEMLSELGLEDIKIRLVPAIMAYKHYLSGDKIDVRSVI